MLPVAGTAPRAPNISAGKISVSRPISTLKRSGTDADVFVGVLQVAARILDAEDVGNLRQPGHGVHVDLHAAAGRRVVVEHHRQRRVLGDAAVVVEDLLLRRRDEVRRDDRDAVDPFLLGHLA